MPQALSRARATRMHERGPDGQWWGLAGGRAGGCRTAQGSVGFYDIVPAQWATTHKECRKLCSEKMHCLAFEFASFPSGYTRCELCAGSHHTFSLAAL